jgi:hypothetical protein
MFWVQILQSSMKFFNVRKLSNYFTEGWGKKVTLDKKCWCDVKPNQNKNNRM